MLETLEAVFIGIMLGLLILVGVAIGLVVIYATICAAILGAKEIKKIKEERNDGRD